MQAAELCRKLALEHAGQYAQSFAEVSKQRDDLRTENARLKLDLKAFRDGSCSPEEESRAPHTPSERERELRIEDLHIATASDMLGRVDPMQLQGTADQHMLRTVFKEVDRRKMKRLCAEDVIAHMEKTGEVALSLEDLRAAFVAINAACTPKTTLEESDVISLRSMNSMGSIGSLEVESSPPDELNFNGFRMMILRDVHDIVGAEAALTLHEVRQFYIKLSAEQVIVERTRVQKDVLNTEIKESNVPFWLEPCIGFMILVNACTIGISQDFAQESDVWTVVECTCTLVFVLEVIVKLVCEGFCRHFFGPGCAWNLFDFFIVVIAVTDMCFVLSDALDVQSLPPNFGGITIVRLVRLLRIARLVRLLRMRFSKELTLMVHGVITGWKTLCWAFVFLLTLVYILGVLVKQVLDPKTFGSSCGSNSTSEDTCSSSEQLLLKNNPILFATVFRSMFTVFRCLIGDCSSSDGLPLTPHLMDSLGVFFTTGYVLVTCFVLFGVFNLVMAIFVENTLEAARVSQQKRHQARRTEDIRVAQELRNIVLRICTKQRPERRFSKRLSGHFSVSSKNLQTGLFRRFWRRILRQPEEEKQVHIHTDEVPQEEWGAMHMVVTREVFEEVMGDPKVTQILEDLEISVTDHAKLFDIIDSNGSGQLDIVEIIEGLMKLRGPPDKGDVVCAALMVRSLQRELKRLEAEMILRHKALHETQNRSLAYLQLLQSTPRRSNNLDRAETRAVL